MLGSHDQEPGKPCWREPAELSHPPFPAGAAPDLIWKGAAVLVTLLCGTLLPGAGIATGEEAAQPPTLASDQGSAVLPRSELQQALRPSALTSGSICVLIEAAARDHGLPLEFFARVIWQESRFRPGAIGPVTRSGQRAQGIAQFMPLTAAERSLLDPFDPVQALPKSAEFLRQLREEFGNLGLAAAAYNSGPRRVREWLAGAGPMPGETRAYVAAVTGASVEEWARTGGAGPNPERAQPSCRELIARLDHKPPVSSGIYRLLRRTRGRQPPRARAPNE